MGHGMESRSCWGRGRGRWAWDTTKCAVGWAGTTTWRCRCWRCGSWNWNGGGWGGETPAMTMPQARLILAELLEPPRSAERIARVVTAVLQHSEEARIYAWYEATGELPPPRPCPSRPQPPPWV